MWQPGGPHQGAQAHTKVDVQPRAFKTHRDCDVRVSGDVERRLCRSAIVDCDGFHNKHQRLIDPCFNLLDACLRAVCPRSHVDTGVALATRQKR